MKPFRFSLQAVLTIRADQERKALEAFAHAQAELERAQAYRRSVQTDIDDLYCVRREAFQGMTVADSLQQMQQGLCALRERFVKAEAAVEKAGRLTDEKSGKLIDARKNREVVEKLYQKRQARHSADVVRMEQRVLDDFGTLKSVGGLAFKWQ